MAKKKAPSKKKPAAKKAAKRAAPKKSAKKKAAPKRAASKRPSARKKTVPRAHVRPTPPSNRPQPVPPGSEQPAQIAGGNGEEDEHGPMHIPSHKPAPAYAEMHKNDWAGKPPTHNIPIPKR
jgi:hypothetical protein